MPYLRELKRGCWKIQHPLLKKPLLSVRYYCSFNVTAPVEHTLTHVSQPSHESA